MLDDQQPKILGGRFVIERRLGRGGMATVYLARDQRLNRQVAIKILHNQFASDDQFLRRFKHEADSAARLNHPNIVRVYDVGNEGNLQYIVMEYIEGADLKEIIALEGPLPVNRTIRLVQQIAEALEVAHQAGMVHRDVKPQNVLVDRNDQVHLGDFGIAKSDRSSAYTDPGTTFGTADYLAPEQAQGLGATPRSDVYSLGVVTYEMLTGRLPFTGDTPLAVAMQHVQSAPPPPRQFNPAIPPQLETIVLRALSKDPEQRPASARQFAELLRTYRERGDQPTMAVPAQPHPAQSQPYRTPSQPDAPTVINPDTYDAYGNQAQASRPARPSQPRRQPLNVPPPLAQDTPDGPPKRRSGGCGMFVLAFLLLIGIAGLLYVALFTDLIPQVQQLFGGSGNTAAQPTATTPPGEPTPTVELVAAPNLIGLTENEALSLIQQQGFREFRNPPRTDQAPRATVIEQAIAPDTLVPKGSVITFTLSLGPEQVELPDLTRQSFDSAAGQLAVLGLQVRKVEEPSTAIQQGFVIRQNPNPQLKVDKGSTVELVVSLGDVIRFPGVIGLSREQAVALIRENPDLILDVVDEQGPDQIPNFDQVQPNQVVSATANGQPVENGFFVPRGSRIVLGVRRP